jgi:hypothetical protein
MKTYTKSQENTVREAAARQGLQLHKSRRRDKLALDYDRWMITGLDGAVVAGAGPTGLPSMTLEQAERWIRDPDSRARKATR